MSSGKSPKKGWHPNPAGCLIAGLAFSVMAYFKFVHPDVWGRATKGDMAIAPWIIGFFLVILCLVNDGE